MGQIVSPDTTHSRLASSKLVSLTFRKSSFDAKKFSKQVSSISFSMISLGRSVSSAYGQKYYCIVVPFEDEMSKSKLLPSCCKAVTNLATRIASSATHEVLRLLQLPLGLPGLRCSLCI